VPQVTVIVPPELTAGYRLAGVHTETAADAAAAGQVLDRLLAGSDHPGVIAMHAPFLHDLGERWQRRLAQPAGFLVTALPGGGAHGGGPAPAGESLRELLARAVGYEFTFDPEGSTR
jgi:vacuolar-type H+-ATPase subunit F/Vma7